MTAIGSYALWSCLSQGWDKAVIDWSLPLLLLILSGMTHRLYCFH